MKFSEMPYERPDLDKVKRELGDLTARLKAAKSYEEARAVFLEKEAAERHVDTLVTLASIRNSIDTRDEFYDGEMNYWNAAGPELEEYDKAWTAAMLASPFRKDFAAEYGDLMFVNAEIELKTFAPEIVPQLQRENDLTQAYQKLIASAKIPFLSLRSSQWPIRVEVQPMAFTMEAGRLVVKAPKLPPTAVFIR